MKDFYIRQKILLYPFRDILFMISFLWIDYLSVGIEQMYEFLLKKMLLY